MDLFPFHLVYKFLILHALTVVVYDAVEALSVISHRFSVCCEPCRRRIGFCFCAVILVYARAYYCVRVVVVYLT